MEQLTLTKLREICKIYNVHTKISKYSKLKKDELINEMKKHLEYNNNEIKPINTIIKIPSKTIEKLIEEKPKNINIIKEEPKNTENNDLQTKYETMKKRKIWIENKILEIMYEINEDGSLKYPMDKGIARPEIVQKRIDNLRMEDDILSDKMRSLEQKMIKINKKKDKEDKNINIIKEEPKNTENNKKEFKNYIDNKYTDTLNKFDSKLINNNEILETKKKELKTLQNEYLNEIQNKYKLLVPTGKSFPSKSIEGNIIVSIRKYRDRLNAIDNRLKNLKLEKEKDDFDIGDYVYIMRGKNKGEKGSIYKINDDTGEVVLVKVGFYEDKQYRPNGGIERIIYKRYNLNPLAKANLILTNIKNIHYEPEKPDFDFGA
jgi:ribosomal protein L24